MRGRAVLLGVVTLLAVLHFILHLGLGLGREAPDLLTVALLILAREVGTGTAAGVGLGFGLLEDAFSVLAFGGNAVALTMVGALGAGTRELFVGDSFLFLVSYLALGKWLRDLIHWVAAGEGLREPFLESVLMGSTLASLYAAGVGLVVLLATGVWGGIRG